MGTTNSPIPRPAPTCVRGERKPLPRKRGRGWGEGALLLLLSLAAHAAPPNPPSLHTTWFAPRAAAFHQSSQQMAPAIESLCTASPEAAQAALEKARSQWLASLGAWERLSAVALGPVLERRSQRQIDFSPTRPRSIEKAVKAAPASAQDMEFIGTPAKGFPALEWLLWVKPVQPASPECRYAVQLAREIGREAEALTAARPAVQEPQAALSELLNQWIGGLERLRWASLEMPQRVAMTAAGKTVPDFPRKASGAAPASWAAQWDALKSLAIGPDALESTLRGRGQGKTADALATAIRRADAALAGLDGRDGERVLAAGQTLADLKRLAEGEVATALGVSIGFSDSDGD